MQRRLRLSDGPSRTWYRGVTHSEADGRLAGVEVTGRRRYCGFALSCTRFNLTGLTGRQPGPSHAGNGRSKDKRVLDGRQDGDCKISASAGHEGQRPSYDLTLSARLLFGYTPCRFG
jgi:hypothetical protein